MTAGRSSISSIRSEHHISREANLVHLRNYTMTRIDTKAATVPELIALARAEPGKLSFRAHWCRMV